MKNRSLEELACTLLNNLKLPKYFWIDVVNIVCYVLNRVLITHFETKRLSELYK